MRTSIRIFAVLAVALVAGASSGCMSMLTPSSRAVHVTSSVRGTVASSSGQQVLTPGLLVLDRADDHAIQFSAPGHDPQTIVIRSHNKPGLWIGSIVLNTLAFGWWSLGIGTVIGVAVDASTGSLRDLPEDGSAAPLPRRGSSEPYAQPPPPPQAPPAASSSPPAGPPGPRAKIFCPRCGVRYSDEADSYCRICGTRRPE